MSNINPNETLSFYVFAWNEYYPKGGFKDLVFGANSIDECWKYLAKNSQDHYQIVSDKFEVIVEG